MFEVRCYSPLDEEWESRDDRITEVAGRKSDGSGAAFGVCRGGEMGERDHFWNVETLEKAKELVDKLNQILLVRASFKEASTPQRKRYKK